MRITFAFPNSALPSWVAAGVAALVIVAVVLRQFEKRRQSRLKRFVEDHLAPRLLAGYDASVRRPLTVLAVLGFAFLILTFFQPHWGHAWEEVQQSSRDVLVVLDTSESMRATDILPSRLERARQEIQTLLERARGDRFGLVAFSGAAALQCPLTLDHGYFRAVLNATDTDTISRKGTDIAAALREARKLFEEEQKEAGQVNPNARAVLLISDGEQVSGDAVEEAKQLASYARIFVVGVGNSEGSVIRAPDWMGVRRNRIEGSDTHVSRLDEDTLMRIAGAGSGVYTRSRADSWDVDQIYDRFRTLAAREVSSDLRLRMVNRYQWPLVAALGCFAGEGFWLVAMPWVRVWRLRREERAKRAAPADRRKLAQEGGHA